MNYPDFVIRMRKQGFEIEIDAATQVVLREFTKQSIVQDPVSRELFRLCFQEDEQKSFYLHDLQSHVLSRARPPSYLYCRQRFEEAMRRIFYGVVGIQNKPETKRYGRQALIMIAFEFLVTDVIEDLLVHQHLEDSWNASGDKP